MNSAYLEAVIKELRDELDTIQQTIDGLELLTARPRRSRGRLPKGLKELNGTASLRTIAEALEKPKRAITGDIDWK
jgi:hypothetical protein